MWNLEMFSENLRSCEFPDTLWIFSRYGKFGRKKKSSYSKAFSNDSNEEFETVNFMVKLFKNFWGTRPRK